VVVTSATLEDTPRTVVRREAGEVEVRSNAEEPVVDPRPILFEAGTRELRCALLLPEGQEPEEPLPVLCDPYGGPWFQRVLRNRVAYAESQWLADQGFAVLVADGRGTPGRGIEWEKSVRGVLPGPAVEDQVDAVRAASERFGFLDRSRVAIRGWSFGGELAAFCVLRHPDVFHAAIVGAPATEQRLYDTHYTERYLGLPQEDPEAYRRGSVVEEAAELSRPVLLIHGLVDDNVLAANAIRLSRALLVAGKPHTFLPLPGATHMANEVEIAEQLLWLELAFLRDALEMG
jgi:dipeptidyl-peptidase-4